MKHNSLYPDIHPRQLGKYFTDHLMAMTEADLFGKSDIAIQLAWRDAEIASLREIIDNLNRKASLAGRTE